MPVQPFYFPSKAIKNKRLDKTEYLSSFLYILQPLKPGFGVILTSVNCTRILWHVNLTFQRLADFELWQYQTFYRSWQTSRSSTLGQSIISSRIIAGEAVRKQLLLLADKCDSVNVYKHSFFHKWRLKYIA